MLAYTRLALVSDPLLESCTVPGRAKKDIDLEHIQGGKAIFKLFEKIAVLPGLIMNQTEWNSLIISSKIYHFATKTGNV